MKIKFLFGLMFVLAAFTVQAQSFVGAEEAITILQSTATSLENGTANIDNLPSADDNTVTGTDANLGGMSIEDVSTRIYPQLMYLTSKNIDEANNTQLGIQETRDLVTAQMSTAVASRQQVVDDALDYIVDLLSI
jgi:D-alanyl-D-alanine dipeptidase